MPMKKDSRKKPAPSHDLTGSDLDKAGRKIAVSVSFSSSAQGDNMLESFTICGRTFLVSEVIDGWYGADHTYVKLVATDGCLYILRHDLTKNEWEIVLMEAALDEK